VTEETKKLKIKREHVRVLAGKRVTVDKTASKIVGTWTIESPTQPDVLWHLRRLDLNTISTMSTEKLMDMLADLSPEIGKALWDWLRMCNPGWEIEAYQLKADEHDDRGQAVIDAFLETLETTYGTVDVVINRFFMNAFLRGAMLGEIVLDGGRTAVDLVSPDPWSVRFRKEQDPVRGPVYALGQYQDGLWVPLDYESIKYVPIDPLPGSPYGRPVASPALFSALFLIAILHDLRRVVEQQGYPRLDVGIDTDRLMGMMPDDLESDPDAVQEWLDAAFEEIRTAYEGLRPDDAYVHADYISVNRPVGTVGTDSLGAIDALLRGLERMITRGVKSMPLMMGSNESVSETHANRQWEIMIAGIKSVQHLLETTLGQLLKLACRAQGVQCRVEVRFAELRASEELRDEQVKAMKISNATAMYDQGWISQDEAAETVTGHEADEDEPRAQPQAAPGLGLGELVVAEQQPNEGQAQEEGAPVEPEVERNRARAVRKTTIPNGANNPLPILPDEEVLDIDEILAALDSWDRLYPDRVGLVGAKSDGATGDLWPALAALVVSDWIYRRNSGRFYNSQTQELLTRNQLIEIRDTFTLQVRAESRAISQAMIDGNTTVQRWLLDMQDMVRNTHTNQFMLGRGGVGMVNANDLRVVEQTITNQYSYLQNFANEVAAGNVSDGRLLARAQMYADAGTQSYERGVALAYGLPTLPNYPGDGATQCLSNCKCRWSVTEDEEAWYCYWVLGVAEHCDDCVANATRWAPLIVPKSRANRRQDLDAHLATVGGNHGHDHHG